MKNGKKEQDFFSGKRVLVTGGAGFIGSNLVIALVSLGAEVRVVDNFHPELGANEFNLEPVAREVEVFRGDVRDVESMKPLVEWAEVVYHLAAQVSHIDSLSDPFYDLSVNAGGSLTLVELARKLNPRAVLVYGGTRGQYGRVRRLPAKEDETLPCPTDPYGVSKQCGEEYFLLYNRIHGLNTLSVRINNVYGPRAQVKHPKFGILNWFVRLAIDDETIKIYGEGKQLREYNYVDDVVNALLLFPTLPQCFGEKINLGSDEPVSFVDMAKTVVEVAGSGRIEFVEWPEERKKIEVGDFKADITKAKALGWSPKVSLREGLEKTVEYYRRYKAHYW